MDVRPYHLVDEGDLRLIRQRVEAAWRAWAADWFVTAVADIDCPAVPAGLDAARPWLAAGRATAWMRCDDDFPSALSRVLWQQSAMTPVNGASLVADAVAVDAHADLASRLATAVGGGGRFGEAQELPGSVLAAGSGAVAVRLSIHDAGVHLWITPPRPRRHATEGTQPPLDGVVDALQDRRVTVRLLVGQVALSLQNVASLAHGDVIRLPTKLDEPLRLTTEDGTGLCLAHLGACGTRRAAELTSFDHPVS